MSKPNSQAPQKVVLITGAAQGIGSVMVKHFLDAGYDVAALDSDTEAFSEFRKSQDERVASILADVSYEPQVLAAVAEVKQRFGRIDAVVNNAAIMANVPPTQLEIEQWNRVLGVNLTGPFLMAKHAAAALKNSKGTIINIASTRALMSEANTEAYSASKGGILALTHALAMSLAPEIRVNAISPGWIEVSHLKKLSTRHQPELSRADHEQHPVGRVGVASDIAAMAVFLASDEAGFITGQNFVIDGGMTKKMIYV